MIWNEILCLGDSITFGARDCYGRSYPAELGKMLTESLKEFYFCHRDNNHKATKTFIFLWNCYQEAENIF